MRDQAPFIPQDLSELDERLLAQAAHVIAMEDIYDGDRHPNRIGLRHDVDAAHALATAVKMAEWEFARCYRSTYFVLHTSPYWRGRRFQESLEQIAGFGHEIGIHTDALCAAFVTGRDPDEILMEAIDTLRGYGHRIRGVAGHGNRFCNHDAAPGEPWFANDEQFVECARPRGYHGEDQEPDRLITRGDVALKLAPRPLADFGLEYEALQIGLPNPWRVSDSGGKWSNDFSATAAEFRSQHDLQLHLLVHPDWWGQAFAAVPVEAAA